ncbi:MAG: hypothetical protein ACTHYM_13985 [Actinomycetaceae bacterium]
MSENPDNDFMDRMANDTRQLVMALLQAGERYARELERQRDLTANAAQGEARRASEWLEAERQTQGAVRAFAADPRGWDRLSDEQVATMYGRVAAWAKFEPSGAQENEQMRSYLNDRWGMDPDEFMRRAREQDNRAQQDEAQAVTLTNEAGLVEQRELTRRDQQQADQARDLDGDGRADNISPITDEEIAALKWDTDQAKATMAAAWDSPERRQRIAEQMRSDGLSEEAISSRITADKGVGQEPQAAVEKAPNTNQTTARRARTIGRGQDRGR